MCVLLMAGLVGLSTSDRILTSYRYPYRLNLSSQSSRSCALPNIKALKDKDLEFANSIRSFCRQE
jgi:hypothetical protein